MGRVVCSRAERLGAALVVLPATDHSWLHKLVAGSVAAHVEKHCAAPVRMVRPEELPVAALQRGGSGGVAAEAAS